MKYVAFNSFCPYEVGDKVYVERKQQEVIITDIASVHYVRDGNVKFIYELNHSGSYVSFKEQNVHTKRLELRDGVKNIVKGFENIMRDLGIEIPRCMHIDAATENRVFSLIKSARMLGLENVSFGYEKPNSPRAKFYITLHHDICNLTVVTDDGIDFYEITDKFKYIKSEP
jgi:hypothetical protein